MAKAAIVARSSFPTTMIRFILVQVSHFGSPYIYVVMTPVSKKNRQGKTRLSKWYVPYDDDEKVRSRCLLEPSMLLILILKVRLRGEVHRLVAPRDQKYQSNFVEVRCPL